MYPKQTIHLFVQGTEFDGDEFVIYNKYALYFVINLIISYF